MNEPRNISIRCRIVWSFVAVALAWLGLEALMLAWAWLAPSRASHLQFLYEAHPYRAVAPKPNAIDSDGMRSFNSFGTRGPELPVDKPADTVRVVCLGASTTFSDRATSDSLSWPARMERFLNHHYREAPYRIEVVNAGIQGTMTIESLIYLQTRLLDLSPDVAILHHGVNEAWAMLEVPGFRSDYSHVRHTFSLPAPAWWEYSPTLSYLFAKNSINNPYFPQDNANMYLLMIRTPSLIWNPAGGRQGALEPQMIETYRRNLRTFLALCRANGILPVLTTQTAGGNDPHVKRLVAAMDTLNENVRDLAGTEDVALIDCAARMPWEEGTFYDICHVIDGPAGLGRKAQIFAQGLIEARSIEHAWEEQTGGEEAR